MTMAGEVLQGDCLEVLRSMADGSANLIVTSPPYAERRKDTYGGIPEADYCAWFLPIALELKRVLAEDGSFILNIKEGVVDGQRSLYVYQLVAALVEQGWLWIDEFIWHKVNPVPGKWPNRLKDGFERLYHFTKSPNPQMFQKNVLQKAQPRPGKANELARLVRQNRGRVVSKTGSGFGKDEVKSRPDMVLPSNVLYMTVIGKNVGHSAAFPVALPAFFIRLFTKPGDLVLDPFGGSGTVGEAAVALDRRFILIEQQAKYVTTIGLRLGGPTDQDPLEG